MRFGDRFNQRLDDVDWPSHLQTLAFGTDFNQNLQNSCKLPPALGTLIFGDHFQQNLEGIDLPTSLLVFFCLKISKFFVCFENMCFFAVAKSSGN